MHRIDHDNHHQELLAQLWRVNDRFFSGFTLQEQWDLHRYYNFTKQLTSDRLRFHRKKVSAEDWSLAAQDRHDLQVPPTNSTRSKGNRIMHNEIIGRLLPEGQLRFIATPERITGRSRKPSFRLAEDENREKRELKDAV